MSSTKRVSPAILLGPCRAASVHSSPLVTTRSAPASSSPSHTRFHLVQQRHGRGDGVVAVGAIDGARMRVLADAAGIAEALAAADARDHRRRQAAGDERRTLLDVQLEISADACRIQQPAPFPDGLRVEAPLPERRLEAAAVVRACDREAGGIEQPEGAAAAQIGDVEPGRLLGANAHDGQVAGRHVAGAAHARQHAQAGDDAGGAVEVAALRDAVEMRAHHDARCGAVAPRAVSSTGCRGRRSRSRAPCAAPRRARCRAPACSPAP